MILVFRITLLILAISFTYLFGGTMEKFFLEVVRAFISLEPSNALVFNGAHLAVSVSPLILLGIVLSISLGGEADLKKSLWKVVVGIVLGVTSFRVYQIWWVFRGGIGEEANSWTESMSHSQLFFLEKILPFIALGTLSSLAPAWGKSLSFKEKTANAGFSIIFTLLWLWSTHKIQNIYGFSQTAIAVSTSLFCGLAVVSITEKINPF